MAQSVLRGTHVMLGRDLHIPWPPGAPGPAPAPVPYLTGQRLLASEVTCLHAASVFTEATSPAMLRGTDIGPGIMHDGTPSLTLPLELATSGSKSYFGASSIELRDQHGNPGHLASAVLGLAGLNLNCGTPSPSAFGMVIAPTTVQQSMRLGDVVVGLKLLVTDYMLQRITARLGELGAHGGARAIDVLGRRLGAGVLGRVAVRFASGTGGRGLAQLADGVKLWGATPLGFAIGSPLGASISNVHGPRDETIIPSGLDLASSLADRAAAATDDAVRAYLADPSIAEIPLGL